MGVAYYKKVCNLQMDLQTYARFSGKVVVSRRTAD